VTRDPLAGIHLEALIADTLHMASAREGDEFSIAGPAVYLVPKAAETLGLALHELVTNAVKYGALSRQSGHIAVSWTMTDGDEGELRFLHLEWIETGMRLRGSERRRNGFGTELLTRTLAYDLDATVTRQFSTTGVRYAIGLPATARIIKNPG
jgi:two-component sensor histidine kinase